MQDGAADGGHEDGGGVRARLGAAFPREKTPLAPSQGTHVEPRNSQVWRITHHSVTDIQPKRFMFSVSRRSFLIFIEGRRKSQTQSCSCDRLSHQCMIKTVCLKCVFLVGRSTNVMRSYVVKTRGNSFYSTFYRSMLWTITVSRTPSPTQVSSV